MQSVLLVLLIAACVWLALAESLVSALAFFVFGLVVIGGLSFMLGLGGVTRWAASSITAYAALAAIETIPPDTP